MPIVEILGAGCNVVAITSRRSCGSSFGSGGIINSRFVIVTAGAISRQISGVD